MPKDNNQEVKKVNVEATKSNPQKTIVKPLLVVEDLKKYFPLGSSFLAKNRQYVKAVDGVSFTIDPGKTLGVVGESGCGKTTLGRTILRLHSITSGKVMYDDIDLVSISKKEMTKLRPKIQIIFQDPYSSLSPRMTIGEIIGEAVRQHGIVPKDEYKDYIIETMRLCGLPAYYFSRYPHEFSGGQRQRISIARSLALKPDLIICDEPVSALDVSIQAQIINLLVELQKNMGITYIFISHDLSVVEYISDEIMVMYLGTVVEHASTKQIFGNTMHPYTKALLSAVPVPDPDSKKQRIILTGDIPSPANPPKGCKFHTRCSECMEICKTVEPKLKEYEPGHFVACHLYPQD
ncbi:MAG: dipeptide ABC transporter ATP-binding protein [Candidatus Izemoplasmatales bacterium]